jgi:aminotransferase
MELPINPAVTNVAPSGIRRIFNLASDLSRQGRRVFPFHLGTPDFDTPDVIKAFAIQKLQEGFVHYAPNAGIPELRRLIARSVNQQRGTDYSEQSVIVTIGACEAISIALMAVMEPDSEVIVPTPCWMNYLMLPRILGARVVEVPTDPASFLPDAEQLRAHITPKTRAIMLNTPGNPTGVVIPPERLAAIVALARERGIWLLCDEVYEQIVYAGHAHHSPVSVPGAGDVCILIGGFSKTYSMTGWRLGYVLGPQPVVDAMLKVHQYLVTSATSFTQWGAVKALEENPGVTAMQAAYQERCDMVVNGLRRAPTHSRTMRHSAGTCWPNTASPSCQAACSALLTTVISACALPARQPTCGRAWMFLSAHFKGLFKRRHHRENIFPARHDLA